YVIAQGALVEPGFHQRCYAAKDESTARKGIILSIGFWALFDFMTTLCGLYAFALLPDLANPVMAFPALALMTLPPAILGIFVTGLLSVVMSTIDSNSFIAATTYSHDIMAKLRKHTHSDTLRKDTIVGLVLSTIIALLISLVFDSVIDIWREIGSILAPALLIPVLLAFCGDKITRKNFSDCEILAIMITGGGISLIWILYAHLTPGGAYPFAQYPFISEPIFPGLYSSIALYLALHLRQPHLK
ncbi:MAG: hypothetical protein IIB00_11460, partial [candidate division Zixibacteria bacterium]|nr:hypothetical protein [candidate division Zixibacteria bacterium]